MKDLYIKTPTGRLCYRFKSNKGKTIVFLHGASGSLSAWDFIYPYFYEKGYSILLIDLRGHGKSIRSKNWFDYKLEEHAQDIATILKRKRVKKFILVGHCLGGMIGATFTFLYPKQVEKLILINPGLNKRTFFFNSITHSFLLMIFSLINLVPFDIKANKQNRVDYKSYVNSHDFSPWRIFDDLKHTGIRPLISQTQAFFEWQGEKYYNNVDIPTLIIGGKKDHVFNIHISKIIKKLLKNSRLKLINTNHISVINKPEQICEEIIKFIQ